MVLHVQDAAMRSGAMAVTVATDDQRIVSVVQAAGGHAVLTAVDHETGSDRIAEACTILGLSPDAVVVNVQGDEPEISPLLIRQVAELLMSRKDAVMATLCTPVSGVAEFVDVAAVKVVVGKNDQALYFSRAPLPWDCGHSSTGRAAEAWRSAWRHVGIYAYRVRYLWHFARCGPCPLEQWERLEQLRALWHGECVVCGVAAVPPPPGVDTREDLAHARLRLGRNQNP